MSSAAVDVKHVAEREGVRTGAEIGTGAGSGSRTNPNPRRNTRLSLDDIIRDALKNECDVANKESERYTRHFLYYVKMNFDGDDAKSINEFYKKLESDESIRECTPLIIRSNSNTRAPQVDGSTIFSVPPSLWVYGYDASGINLTLEKLRLSEKERKELDELKYQDDIKVIIRGSIAYYKRNSDLTDKAEQKKIIDEFTQEINLRVTAGKSKCCYCIMDKNGEIFIFGHQSSVLDPTLRRLEKGKRCHQYFKDEIADHFEVGEYGGEGINGQGDKYCFEGQNSIATLLHRQIKFFKIIPPHELDEYSWEYVEPIPGGGAVETQIREYSLGMRTQGIIAITRRNPAVEAILWSYITRTTLNEFSKAYGLAEALPYFIGAGAAGSFIGFGLGYKTLTSPEILWQTKGSGPYYRLLFGIRDGLIVFIGINILTIAAVLSENPDEGHVSNETFWTKIELAPMIGGLAVTAWRATSLLTKNKYLKPLAEMILESVSDVLVHQGMWSTFFLNTCELPLYDSAAYGSIAGVGSAVFAKKLLTCLNKDYHSTPYTTLLYCFCVNAAYDMARTFYSDPKLKKVAEQNGEGEAYYYMMLMHTVLLGIQVLAAFLLTRRNRAKFIQNFRGEADFTSTVTIEHPFAGHLMSDDDEVTIELVRHFDVYVSVEKEFSKDMDVSKIVEIVENNGRNKIVIVLRDGKYFACVFNEDKWLSEESANESANQSSEAEKTKVELKFVDVHQLVSEVQGTAVGKTVFPNVEQDLKTDKKGEKEEDESDRLLSSAAASSAIPNTKPISVNRENALFLGKFIHSVLTIAKLPMPLIEFVVPRVSHGSVELSERGAGGGLDAGGSADDRKSGADSAASASAATAGALGAKAPLLHAYGRSQTVSAAADALSGQAVEDEFSVSLEANVSTVTSSGSGGGGAGGYKKL